MTTEKFGRYEVKHPLGQGGMAVVYLAYDPQMTREVAVKVLPSHLTNDPHLRYRLEREVRTVAKLEHPCIVPVYDYGEQHNQPYVVMRYMPGGSLLSRISQQPLTGVELSPMIDRLARALDNAHSHNIIHRDIKPSNILFDGQGQAYLSDFGIARIVEDLATKTKTGTIGTPAYMSPEQGSGGRVLDGRSDIYGLGIVIFEALTGQLPYQADTPIAMMMQHITKEIPSICQVRPDLSPDYEIVIRQAMAKTPEGRYPTAAALAEDLAAVATGKTIHPRVELLGEPTESIVDLTRSFKPSQSNPAQAIAEKKASEGLNKWVSGALALLGLGLLAISVVAGIALTGGLGSDPTSTQLIVAKISSPETLGLIAETDSTTPLPTFTSTSIPTPTPTPASSPTVVPTNTTTPPAFTPLLTPSTSDEEEPLPTPATLTEFGLIVDNFEDYSGNSTLNELYRINAAWEANQGVLKLVGSPHAAEGEQALAFEFEITAAFPNHYSGFERRIFPQDWSEFSSLCFWIESNGSGYDLVTQFGELESEVWKHRVALSTLDAEELCLSLNQDDFVWADWSTPGNNQIDLAAIAYYGFFVEGPPQGPGVIYLDDIQVRREATPTPPPTQTPTPIPPTVACADEPQSDFRNLWARYKDRLGCPEQSMPTAGFFAEQSFQYGHMFWVENGDFYLITLGNEGGTWRFFAGNESPWQEGMPAKSCDLPLPEGLIHPVRGFGGLWCAYDDLRQQIGGGLRDEQGFEDGVDLIQTFEKGFIFRDSDGFSRGLAYLLFQDDGTFVREAY